MTQTEVEGLEKFHDEHPDICNCICHVKGKLILHDRNCCEYLGDSWYINKDFTLDKNVYEKGVEYTKLLNKG